MLNFTKDLKTNMNWSLNVSNFTWIDRIKLCSFFLNPYNRWTMGDKVAEYEKQMADFMGFTYAVFVSSGSTANTMLAMHLKDKMMKLDHNRQIVVLPSTTWTTSCSPFIREGFTPKFIDVSLSNFSIDTNKLLAFVSQNHSKIAAIFPTSLLGFNTNYDVLGIIKRDYPDINIFVDQCENNFGGLESFAWNQADFMKFTSTTSTYFGHQLQSVEGGFLFTNCNREYEAFLMYRNHGMVRSLSDDTKTAKGIYENKNVDHRFDFYSLGNNFRNSDVHATIGLLDFKRKYSYIRKRRRLYALFQSNLNKDRYILPEDSMSNSYYVPFCLPIICKGETSKERLHKIKMYCIENNIESRPIISGFLGYQTAYKGMMEEKDSPNSVYLHNNGIYVGLHTKLKNKQILELVEFLNKI